MSDESIPFRKPTPDELRLISALIRKVPRLMINVGWLNEVRVQRMDDGGMGSFRLGLISSHQTDRSMGAVAATLQFTDEDGVLVEVALNTDTEGEPFEVDVWRTDFNPVRRIPDQL